MKGARNRPRRQRTIEHVAIAGIAYNVALDHGLCQFLGKERYAIRACHDLSDDVRRKKFWAGDLLDKHRGLASRKPAQGHCRDMRPPRPRCIKLWAVREEQQHGKALHAIDHEIDQLA